jgi:hypothetical protein
MPEEIKHIKAYISEKQNSIDESNYKILFMIPEITDRDDEIVTAQAIYNAIKDKKTFAANPACQPCHQSRLDDGKPPSVGHWDVETAKLVPGGVEIWLEFGVGPRPKEELITLGDFYWWTYSHKHMRAVSIGFRTIAFEDIEVSI